VSSKPGAGQHAVPIERSTELFGQQFNARLLSALRSLEQ
jgi:hypothetical protein